MLKLVGGVVIIGMLTLGAAMFFGWMNIEADAGLTAKGEQQFKELREQTADKIRGK